MTSDAARLQAGICPVCGSGPWLSVAHHAARKHGVDRRALRDMVGLPWSAPVAAPDVLERGREAAIGRNQGARLTKGLGRDLHAVSTAGAQARLRAITEHRHSAPRKIPTDAGPAIQARIDQGERLVDIGATWGASAAAVSRFMKAHRETR